MTKFLNIKGTLVDTDSLYGLTHRCDPRKCIDSGCCCHNYEVFVEDDEIDTIIAWQPLAAEYAPHLSSAGDLANVFDDAGHGLYLIDEQDNGACAFAYYDEAGRCLCSLHSAALAAGEDPTAVKPRSCRLWPLATVDVKPPILTIQSDAYTYPCNAKKKLKVGKLDSEIAVIVADLYGDEFLGQLEERRKIHVGLITITLVFLLQLTWWLWHSLES